MGTVIIVLLVLVVFGVVPWFAPLAVGAAYILWMLFVVFLGWIQKR